MLKQPDDINLWNEFRRYFTAFVVEDIKKSLQADIQVGTIILTTVGIECLGGYYTGKEADRVPFVKFMQMFMPSYAKYADGIYTCIRNGLAHDYVINEDKSTNLTFVFKGKCGEPHLSPVSANSSVIYFNRVNYANDFLEAQNQYFEKVENDPSLWGNAMKRLKNKKGFLTVRPLNMFVTASTEEPYPGTLAKPSDTNRSTGTSIKRPDIIE